uniref:Uncharacterized protein n=1 Tax=Caenorhabditis japonica TaxID=281687 RepID=A0A8R1IDR2_CAEJA
MVEEEDQPIARPPLVPYLVTLHFLPSLFASLFSLPTLAILSDMSFIPEAIDPAALMSLLMQSSSSKSSTPLDTHSEGSESPDSTASNCSEPSAKRRRKPESEWSELIVS